MGEHAVNYEQFSGPPDLPNIPEPLESEQSPDFLQFQEGALQFLEERGLISYDGGKLLIDEEKIKHITLNFPGEKHSLGRQPNQKFLETFKHIHGDSSFSFLIKTFEGKKAISQTEWKKYKEGKIEYEPQPSDVFYTPHTLEDAFDREKIQSAQFHIAPWELANSMKEGNDLYPGTKQDIPFLEASVACMLYHPLYGNAYRDEKGQLIVASLREDGSTPKKITREIFSKLRYRTKQTEELYTNPKSFLLEGNFPHLQEANLLKPNDFRYLSTHEKNKYDLYRDITHPKGYVMLEGVRYSLGSQFAPTQNETFRIYKLSDKNAGVIRIDAKTHEETLVNMFDLLPDDPNHALRQKERKTSYIDVTQKWTNLRSYPPTDQEKQWFNDEDFQAGNDFAHFIALRKAVAKEAGFDFMSLTPYEQEAFLKYFQSAQEEEKQTLYTFLKNFGINGAKTFSAVYVDSQAPEKIFAIVKNYEPVQARLIFRKYAELTDRRHMLDQELADFFGDENEADRVQKGEITKALMKRAGELLHSYATIEKKTNNSALLSHELSHIETDAVVFIQILKQIKRENINFSLEQAKNIEFSCRDINSITPEERLEMMKLYSDNYSNNPPFRDELLAKFSDLLDNKKENVKFYILKNKGKIIGFCRFDTLDENTEYFASFNVDGKYQGASLGRNILQKTVDERAKNKILKAECDASNFTSKVYITNGFVARKFYWYKGVPVFDIFRNDKENQKYEYKNKSQKEIVDLYDLNEDGIVEIGKNLIVRSDEETLQFPFPLLEEGYVITQYFSKDGKVYAVFEPEIMNEEKSSALAE